MKKYIKIFFSLSAEEFRDEINEIEAFIGSLNNIYIRRDIFFEIKECEDLSSAFQMEGEQTQYKEYMKQCRYFYLLFGKSAEKSAQEAFNIALEHFQSNGAPKIYTYFKQLPEGEHAQKSVLDFMERLDCQLGHYYNTFVHLDAVKLNLLLELALDGQLNSVMEFQNGQAYLDKQPVMSLENVPLYYGNETLQQKKERKKKLDAEYAVLVSESGKNPADEELGDKIWELVGERKKIQEAIHQIEMDMLKMCQETAQKRRSGIKMNWREKKAIEFVDQGNYEGAKNILRDAQWDEEIRQAEEELELVEKKKIDKLEEIREFISGRRALISNLKATGLDHESVKEITDIYEEIIVRAEKYQMELKVLYEYASFLYLQNRLTEGIVAAEKLRCFYDNSKETADEDKAQLLNILSLLYHKNHDFYHAVELGREALGYYRRLTEKNPQVYAAYEASLINNLAALLMEMNKTAEAEALYREALDLYRCLTEKKPRVFADYEENLAAMKALTISNLAVLLGNMNRMEEAEGLLGEAWEALGAANALRRLAANNLKYYDVDVAGSNLNLAEVLRRMGKKSVAKRLLMQALRIYRLLAANNPEAYEPQVAACISYMAILMGEMNRVKEAEGLLREALEMYRLLAAKNPEAYEPQAAACANNLANMLEKMNQENAADEL